MQFILVPGKDQSSSQIDKILVTGQQIIHILHSCCRNKYIALLKRVRSLEKLYGLGILTRGMCRTPDNCKSLETKSHYL